MTTRHKLTQRRRYITDQQPDLIIRAGRVFCADTGLDGPGAVAVRGDRIVASGPNVSGPAKQTLDFPDGTLLPGLVDLHAHPGPEAVRPAPPLRWTEPVGYRPFGRSYDRCDPAECGRRPAAHRAGLRWSGRRSRTAQLGPGVGRGCWRAQAQHRAPATAAAKASPRHRGHRAPAHGRNVCVVPRQILRF